MIITSCDDGDTLGVWYPVEEEEEEEN